MYANFDPAYFTSIKAVRIKSRLGREADVYPIRLWAFCATHAPDGILLGYNPSEIEVILDWSGESGKLFSALVEIGFVDVGEKAYVVHQFVEHNGHINAYRERSRKANASRWSRVSKQSNKDGEGLLKDSLGIPSDVQQGVPFKEEKKDKLEKPVSSVFGGVQGGAEGNHPLIIANQGNHSEPTFAEKLEPFDLASVTPPDTIPQSEVAQAYAYFLTAWDQACESTGWNKIGFAALGSRVVAWNRKWDGSKWFRDNWPRALERACRSPFLTGKTKQSWTMTPDWFLKADNAEKIDEGQYDGAGPKQTGKLTAGDIRRMATLAKEKGQ